jgi:hypothetical protein
MSSPARFPFVSRGTGGPVPDLAPLLPIRLSRGSVTLDVVGLVDSGAAVSVLPWSVGARFGTDWNSLTVPCSVGGSAGGIAGKLLVVDGTVSPFGAVQLAFAWVQSDAVPLLLGQTNFFMAFDVFFYRTRGYFEVQPASPATPSTP